MRLVCGIILLLHALLVARAPAQLTTAPRGDALAAELKSRGEADVLVMLREPATRHRGGVAVRRQAINALREGVVSGLDPSAVRIRRRFSMVSGFTATVTARGAAALRADPAVLRIDPMMYGGGALAQSVPRVRADAVQRRGDLGQGVTVAVLDAGVDTAHPDLTGSIVAEHCICTGGCCPDGSAEQAGPGSAFTDFVHGIHVTGIIVSKGVVAPAGIAPAAKVVAVKVLNDRNRGLLADWIAALDWIATERPDVQAVNMSLVSDTMFAGKCDEADAFTMAFAEVLQELRARGTLTFVASGNSGQSSAMGMPACVSAAVAVGATTRTDRVWPFTNSDAALDLLAPGVGIVSTGPGGRAAILSGTSMATPHVTGAAALLLAVSPSLRADQLEGLLKDRGVPLVDARNGLTFPRLNALSAMNAALDVTRPLLGGGSARSDCLVEWKIPATTVTSRHRRTAVACRDTDPACDADKIAGQCTLSLSVCFKVRDRRLPRCEADAPIVASAFTLSARKRGALDAANRRALSAALLPLPITGDTRCTAPVAFVVPVGEAQWIRFSARAADGRRDYDRLRLTCVASE